MCTFKHCHHHQPNTPAHPLYLEGRLTMHNKKVSTELFSLIEKLYNIIQIFTVSCQLPQSVLKRLSRFPRCVLLPCYADASQSVGYTAVWHSPHSLRRYWRILSVCFQDKPRENAQKHPQKWTHRMCLARSISKPWETGLRRRGTQRDPG